MNPGFLKRLLLTYSILVTATIGVWVWALWAFSGHPLLMGSAFLAYTLGLRHAVDADHIVAIDNVTRKLMQEGKRPMNVGLLFSLGHSSVVVLVSAILVITAGMFKSKLAVFAGVGGAIGTLVSAGFLLCLAFINIIIFFQIYRTFKRVQVGCDYTDEDLNTLLSQRGLFSKVFSWLFAKVGKSWQMFPIGFLFGLGFDTSTEVALLGLAGAQALNGLSIWCIMIYPLLFTVAMALVDTTDGILMQQAYHWAYLTPIRKLYYNLVITGLSVLVALVIGGIELLGLAGNRFSLKGSFWSFMNGLNEHTSEMGLTIIGLFLCAWFISVLVYRFRVSEVRS